MNSFLSDHKDKDVLLSVVIPAYNETDSIKETIDEILNVINNIDGITQIQVIVIDDHSSDDTYDIVSQIRDPRVVCLRLSRRSGSFTAIRAGIKEAKGDAVLCISADGQDEPSSLKKMVRKWRNGVKVVWGLRKNRDDEPLHIRLPALLFYRILNWLGGDKDSTIELSRADFCLLDKDVVYPINACTEKNTSLFGLIAWLGFKQDFVEYDRRERKRGKSKWNFRSRLNYSKDWIIAFSGTPLKIASSVGIFTAILGVFYAIFVIINTVFFGNPVQGWASLIVLILVLGGVQLTILGIIGEYLWRNLDESRRRPLFFIERRSDENQVVG